MISPINLDVLRILDAIERRGSFASAAEELFRVPSAISYSVNKLEEDLGVAIFDRTRRKAELTTIGRLVLDQGRKILIATDELTALARQSNDGWETELRICVDSLLDCDPVYRLVDAFQTIQPKVEVQLTEEVLGGTWDALNAGRCDMIIGAAGEAPTTGFGTHFLGEVSFQFVVAKDHPLTQLPQPLSMSAIQNYVTVVVADSSRLLPARSSGLLDGRSRMVVASVERKIDVQKKGLGVGYLPIHRIQKELEEGELQILELEEARPLQPIYAAWRNTNKGKGLTWFIKKIQTMSFDNRAGLY